ncbi:MAG: TIGR03086 family metal-binding protein [Streptosporangiales bacterium]
MTDDPRPMFFRTADQVGRAIAEVGAEQLDQPTPCQEYDVRALLGHLLSVYRRVSTVMAGGEARDVPQVTTGVADDGWQDAFADARTRLADTLADATVLDTPYTFPFGTLPGSAALRAFTFELGVHTWDLVKATNQEAALDPEVGAAALAAARQGLPAEPRDGLPFAAVVRVPDDADVYDQLAGWAGRNPHAVRA